jgi:hypothetical protein
MHIRAPKKTWLLVGITVGLLSLTWLMSAALAQGPETAESRAPAGGSPTYTFSYQGRLLDGGNPANGLYDMKFSFWDASTNGTQLGSTFVYDSPGVDVVDGVFSVNVPPGAQEEVFNGADRWLQVETRPHGVGNYTPLPRQPFTAVPYAWGLRPQAVISGTVVGGDFGQAILSVDAEHYFGSGPATAIYARSNSSSAVYGESDGIGVYGSSTGDHAVHGASTTGTAGYFESGEGFGVEGHSRGTDHYDHGGNFSADMGYGVYASSDQNFGVRGESGSWGGTQPVGQWGVVGMGEDGGVHGGSSNSYGVRGSSSNMVGVYGSSSNDRGVYGYSSNDIGVYGQTNTNSDPAVAGMQTGYYTSDLGGGYFDPGGLFGGKNGVVGITKANSGYGVFGWDKSASGGWAGYFISDNGSGVYASVPSGHVGLNTNGTKPAVVPTDDGARLLYAEESTEVWFTDYGFGQLVDGVAVIVIDEVYAQTVSLEEPYHIFVQVYGDAEVYVTGRTPTQFEVHLREGDANVEFSYRIAAKRLGYEDQRLERAEWADTDPNLFPERAAEWGGQ